MSQGRLRSLLNARGQLPQRAIMACIKIDFVQFKAIYPLRKSPIFSTYSRSRPIYSTSLLPANNMHPSKTPSSIPFIPLRLSTLNCPLQLHCIHNPAFRSQLPNHHRHNITQRLPMVPRIPLPHLRLPIPHAERIQVPSNPHILQPCIREQPRKL